MCSNDKLKSIPVPVIVGFLATGIFFSILGTIRCDEFRQDDDFRQDMGKSRPSVAIRIDTDALRPLIEESVVRHGKVDEEIIGVRSQGTSLTKGHVRAQFQTVEDGIAFQLIFKGSTIAETTGRDGPARLAHRSETEFVATKNVQFDGRRFQASPTVLVQGKTDLKTENIESDLPRLRGLLVRRIAEVQSERTEGEAEQEVFESVSKQVRDDFDQEVATELAIANALRAAALLLTSDASPAAADRPWTLRSTPTHVWLLAGGDALPQVPVNDLAGEIQQAEDAGEPDRTLEIWIHHDELCRRVRPAARVLGVADADLAQSIIVAVGKTFGGCNEVIQQVAGRQDDPCPSVVLLSSGPWTIAGLQLPTVGASEAEAKPPGEEVPRDQPIRNVSLLDRDVLHR